MNNKQQKPECSEPKLQKAMDKARQFFIQRDNNQNLKDVCSYFFQN